jgi:hypothetical protein
MAQKTYISTHDFKAPYVEVTGMPHNPQQVKFKTFRKGQQFRGELKHANNKPAFILAENNAIVGLDTVKEIVTKQVGAETRANEMSAFSGSSTGETKKVSVPTNPKVRYIDAMLLGALVGVVGVVIAEKQGWIPEPDKKYKMYGALAGALASAYIVYRTSNGKPKVQIVNKQEFI